MAERITTHSEGCWRYHLDCAKVEIERLRKQSASRGDAIHRVRGEIFHAQSNGMWLSMDSQGVDGPRIDAVRVSFIEAALAPRPDEEPFE